MFICFICTSAVSSCASSLKKRETDCHKYPLWNIFCSGKGYSLVCLYWKGKDLKAQNCYLQYYGAEGEMILCCYKVRTRDNGWKLRIKWVWIYQFIVQSLRNLCMWGEYIWWIQQITYSKKILNSLEEVKFLPHSMIIKWPLSGNFSSK